VDPRPSHTERQNVITSRLTTKARTTIPRAIRAALRLKEGDKLVYRIDRDRVILSKAPRTTAQHDPFGVFAEWNSRADSNAYAQL